MICQACGVEADTRPVAFYQNIGALVVRFSKSIEGRLCKSCIHKHFWSFTGINFLLGWWGMISLLVTPFFILNNVGRYLWCLGMKPVPAGACAPHLTDEAIEKLQPHVQQIFERLGNQESLDSVAQDVAAKANVTPGQVWMYVQAVVREMRSRSNAGN